MIYYPIQTLISLGIDDIAIVVSGKSPGQFLEVLKNGEEFNLKKITYLYQEKPDAGVADALRLAEDFARGENVAVILGDNCMDSDIDFINSVHEFKSGAKIFLKEVSNPQEFGVARFENNKITEIVEKPKEFISNKAVIGFYLYDSKVFEYIKQLKPSARGQLEISEVNDMYLKDNDLDYQEVKFFWKDAGTYPNLAAVNSYYWHKKS
jgi:glucose-1-phosphate thymidylyltransferase